MLTLTTNFRAEMDKLSGTRPVSILKCDFASGTVYLGDFDYTINSWDGSNRTIRGWVKDWGKLDDVADLNLADTPILGGDLAVTLLIPGGRDGLDTFWTRLIDGVNLPEQTVVSLYLWFRDLDASTDPPIKQWEGTIRGWHWMDELTLHLDLADALTRYDKPVSRVLTTSVFPNLDPDDVGRIENLIYGSVERVRCHAIDAGPNSTLSFDLTDSATVLYYSENDTPFAASGDVWISAEKISYNGKTTETLNGVVHGKLTGLTRGVTPTTAAAHVRGDAIIQTQTNYDYLVAGHKAKAVHKVYVTNDQGELVAIPGTDYSIELNWTGASDGLPRCRIRFNTTLKLTKQFAITETIGVTDTIGGSNAALDLSRNDQGSGGYPTTFVGPNTSERTFPAKPSGATFVSQTVTVKVTNFSVQSGINHLAIGNATAQITAIADYILNSTTEDDSLTINPGNLGSHSITIANITRVLFYTLAPVWTKSGTVTKTGTVTGNSAADIVVGSAVYADVDGHQDDASGTYTGTANALIQLARDVLKHFLNVSLGIALAAIKTSQNLAVKMGTTYELNGLIAEPGQASRWAARLAFEAGCWLKFQAGGATITFRERLFSPAAQVTTHRLAFLQRGHGSADIRPVPIEWILNKIDLRYKRDWTEPRGFEAYRGLEAQQDSASQSRYGIKERPELFFCDFITTPAHALAVATLYRDLYSRRRNLLAWRTRLHHADLEFGDRIRLQDRMAPRAVGELVSADYQPGHALDQRMPALDFLLLEIEEADRMWNRVSKTANYTLVSPADQWTIFDNAGAAGLVVFTLPPATVGQRYLFFRAAAQEIRVDPNGTELFVLDFTSGSATDKTAPTAQAAGKYLGCTASRGLLLLACFTAGEWTTLLRQGVWTIEA